jgi:hypothetical protein
MCRVVLEYEKGADSLRAFSSIYPAINSSHPERSEDVTKVKVSRSRRTPYPHKPPKNLAGRSLDAVGHVDVTGANSLRQH